MGGLEFVVKRTTAGMMTIRAMVLPLPLRVSAAATAAAADCADWNANSFAATANRARWHACLTAGADPNVRA